MGSIMGASGNRSTHPLDAAAGAADMNKWQPISTAPKDGTSLLGWGPNAHGRGQPGCAIIEFVRWPDGTPLTANDVIFTIYARFFYNERKSLSFVVFNVNSFPDFFYADIDLYNMSLIQIKRKNIENVDKQI